MIGVRVFFSTAPDSESHLFLFAELRCVVRLADEPPLRLALRQPSSASTHGAVASTQRERVAGASPREQRTTRSLRDIGTRGCKKILPPSFWPLPPWCRHVRSSFVGLWDTGRSPDEAPLHGACIGCRSTARRAHREGDGERERARARARAITRESQILARRMSQGWAMGRLRCASPCLAKLVSSKGGRPSQVSRVALVWSCRWLRVARAWR